MSDTLDHSLAPELDGPSSEPELRQRKRKTLWITDAELIRRSGVPEKIAYLTLKRLDAAPDLGFPQKQAMWGNRRYWPAVKAYWKAKSKLNSGSSSKGSRHG